MTASNSIVQANYFLQPGYIFLATQPTVISGVTGSGVAVCVYDRKRKIGGMNLFHFPFTRDQEQATGMYGNVAVLTLIKMMEGHGSKPQHLEAQILGGAHNPEISPKNIGRENIRIARTLIHRKRIRLISEDVGGNRGRKIVFNTGKNEIAVLKVERLRAGDWYPYEINR